MTYKTYRIAMIPGDGIGREVMPEGLRMLKTAVRRLGISLGAQYTDWASCDYYQQHDQMTPGDWKQQPQGMGAIPFGVVDWPATVPDHVPLWGSLLKFRREFDQYINLRPVRLFEGMSCPLANRKPDDINYYVTRENTEGEYISFDGIVHEGTGREIVIQESAYSCKGAEWLLKFVFDPTQGRQHKHVALVTKSSGIAISTPQWDKRADEVAQSYPDVTFDKQHIDALTTHSVLQLDCFDMVAITNLSGGILPDLNPATTGTIGLTLSANPNPDRTFPLLSEPAHGSVPNVYGKNIVNPITTTWSGALMLDFLTQGQGVKRAAHNAIAATIETVLEEGPRTSDLGGTTNTIWVGEAIAAYLG